MSTNIPLLNSLIFFICCIGLFLPLLILFYNKGFKSANRYLAGFLFFSSLYLLESFTFLYSDSKNWIAFFTNTHEFFYLIGPFSFFYVRSMLRDESNLDKKDLLHFLPFIVYFIGSISYLFSNWNFKLVVASNMQSENWDMEQFHLNTIVPHKIDQALNVLQIYFYAASLWYLIWKYKRNKSSKVFNIIQYKLIRNWLFIFTLIISIIAINFTATIVNIWIFDDKSVFLQKTSIALLFASIIYIGMNLTMLVFPHIMYGFPIEKIESSTIVDLQNTIKTNDSIAKKNELQPYILLKPEIKDKKEGLLIFSEEYLKKIELALNKSIDYEHYLLPSFKLTYLSTKLALPEHHLTYYFNSILNISFSEWKNKLRVEYIIKLLNEGEASDYTLESISVRAGFTSQNTFIRSFKFHTGKTPSEYLKAIS